MKKITFFLSGFLWMCMPQMYAQQEAVSKVDWTTCSSFHITEPLSELAKKHPYIPKKDKELSRELERERRKPVPFEHSIEEDAVKYGNDPASVQTEMGQRNSVNKAPIKNWAGQTSPYRPSDPSGAAGPNHYVQCINASPFKVFNKNTGANMLTVDLGTLWNPDISSEGDPIVMYDKFADRWFISQFGSPAKIYIAISQTNDPTGSYYVYTFNSAQFPDYLKFSIWADGYYMTSNQGARMYCFERDQMLVGNPNARSVTATFTSGPTSGFYCPLSADAADSELPTVGTPCPFFAYSENAWGGGSVDGVKIWNMAVSWGATPTATITAQPTITTAAFDASYDWNWNDVTQPGTTDKLDGIGGVATYRAQWRKWTGYNTVCLNWGVKISSTQRSIKWVELRQDQNTGTWSLYQEGTYTPDAHTRWIGSIAMDDNGSIGLAYSRSSSTVYPSLCYTGRLASDPLGQMTFAEEVAIAGAASDGGNRYGDYSQLSIDPSDGLTFWHTGEYTPAGGTTTRVYSFQLPTSTVASVTIASNDNDNSICPGQSVTFTATPTNGGTPTYQWYLNGVLINGATNVTYTTSTLANNDVVTCEMTSTLAGVEGSPAMSTSITVTITGSPSVSITGNNTICAGSNATFNATVTNPGTWASYQWQLNGNAINGANLSSYSTTSLQNGDVLTCSYTSTCGTVSTVNSQTITMTVNPVPATPTITVNGAVLTSSSATGNQWYLNGVIINGATSQSYTTTTNGNYTVIVTSGGCTSSASSPAPLLYWGVEELSNTGTHFYLYPNPSNGVFSLVFTSTEIKEFKIQLHNSLGQIVYEEEVNKFNGTYLKNFDVTKYGKGQYYVTFNYGKDQKMEKVVVY